MICTNFKTENKTFSNFENIRHRRGSNTRSSLYESDALPLGHCALCLCREKIEVLMSKLIVMLKGLLTPVTVITNYISTSLLVKNYSFQSGHKSYMNK